MYGSSLNFGAMTRWQYQMIKLMDSIAKEKAGQVSLAQLFMAKEAIASTALAHPEWDMDEIKSWDEWEADG